MRSLESLKEEQVLLKKLVDTLEQIEKLGGMTPGLEKDLDNARKKLGDINITIHNLEVGIEYMPDELDVMKLPKSEQADAWLNLLENSDFSKDSILRICSMLKADGLIPVLKKDGVEIDKHIAGKAVKMIYDKGFESLNRKTLRMLFDTKKKIKEGVALTEEEEIYKKLLDAYDDAEDGHVSGKCAMKTHNIFTTMLHDKYEETGDLEDRADYLLDRVVMELEFGGILASGEKEFIANYFEEKNALK